MPLYRYACQSGHTRDEFRKIAERHDELVCECGRDMALKIIPPAVRVFRTYTTVCCDEDGSRKVIGSKRDHEDFLRRNGLEEVGDDKRFAPRAPEEIEEKREREKVRDDGTYMIDDAKIEELKKDGWLQEDIIPA